ncbi:MAG: TlpA family protein disulfide reductase [Oceanospirillales bacterium]|nr:TlpA family protein disulfide reductase [Oceanospirillales bacterium]
MPKHFLLFLMLCVLATPGQATEQDAPEIYTLSFETPDGQPYSLAQHRGEVLLINFWATWCPPCVREMPDLDKLDQAFAQEAFSVIAISAGEASEDIAAFKSRLDSPLALTILLDKEGRTFKEFNLKGLPMSYLFNRQGELVQVITGTEEWAGQEWKSKIKELLTSTP